MRQIVQLFHKAAYLFFIVFGEIAGPVVFIAAAPDNSGGGGGLLLNHIGEHATGLLFVYIAAQAAAAPGNFFPYEYAEAIAQV